MANREHVKRLDEGPAAWNEWRARTGAVPDLSSADLKHRNLGAFDLSGADLRRVHLVGARCTSGNFSGADLRKANLGVFIAQDCSFEGADLSGAFFGWTVLAGTSLRNAVLHDLVHFAPSSIGVDTVFASGGLPDHFLRGCGAPEEFIAYAGSLVGKPIDYYSCFISYSSADDEFAHRLHDNLQGRKIRTWFAPEDLKIGDRFRTRIDESIRVHDKLVLILSEHSIHSAWVRREVETALDREDREKRDVLFPIRVDDAIFASTEAWADEVRRTRHIGDFRNWKSHDDYTKAFERLVKDLQKEGPLIMKA